MITIGLTGGIGSGKTSIARMFEDLGIPIYIADTEAKELMHSSSVIKNELTALLGEDIYKNGELDRPYMASLIFNNKTLLEQVNQIVHPRVAEHFTAWKNAQNAAYCIKENAILFENDGYKDCDYTILVVSDLEVRIQRVMERDGVSREKVLERIKNQWPDEDKIALADFIIINQNLKEVRKEVKKLHNHLLETI